MLCKIQIKTAKHVRRKICSYDMLCKIQIITAKHVRCKICRYDMLCKIQIITANMCAVRSAVMIWCVRYRS